MRAEARRAATGISKRLVSGDALRSLRKRGSSLSE